ncbi:unnamed protein product [Mytilus coruscus]|uniref:DED domain-containing protein n=1 Tax=Mytilus coruscus TaxID=42192 RepID=A0A6J8E1V1_MYTCO|nr:unnamed protein product [Mytilus coruscus]
MEDLTDVLKLESFCCLFGWLKLFLSEALSVSQSDADCCESSVVVDRKVSLSQQEASSFRDDELHLPTPPSDDWPMNVFLNELADELTAEDLKKMKNLLSGLNGTAKGVLEAIKDPLDLFTHLRQKTILTRDNVVFLQAMLWHTKRKDLHNKFVKFAKERGNVIHFYSPSEKPENGYEYVKFHIGGKEKMNRHKLEHLRALVSFALCVPLDFVVVSGIEATNSILVTFMIPEGYAHVLSELSNKEKEYLGSQGVDAIWYNEKLISCIDIEIGEVDSIKKDEEIKLLLDQKNKLDSETESLQIQVLELQQSLRKCQQQSQSIQKNARNELAIITATLIQQYIDVKYSTQELNLNDIAFKNATRHFTHILKKMEKLGYDTNLIKYLLDANTTVVLKRQKNCFAWIEREQQNKIKRLQQDLIMVEYERDKLAYFLKAGISKPVLTENEEFFMRLCAANMHMPFTRTTSVSVEMQEEMTEEIGIERMQEIMFKILKTWDDTLNEKEREILIKKFLPTDAQKAFKESKVPLLEFLWANHIKNDNGADIHLWIVTLLAVIKRMDLHEIWVKKSDLLIKAFMRSGSSEENPCSESEDDIPDLQLHRRNSKKFKPEAKLKTRRKKTPAVEPKYNQPVSEVVYEMREMLARNLKLTERFAHFALDQSSLTGKSESNILTDFSKTYQGRLFTQK